MKMKLNLLLLFSSFCFVSLAQESSWMSIHDTRDVKDSADFIKGIMRLDLKGINTGTPSDFFSVNLTLSPWTDPSGGPVHQLNFNPKGLYHRMSKNDNISWNSWRRILMTEDNLLNEFVLFGQENTDKMSMYQHINGPNRTEFRINVGDDDQGDDRLVIGNTLAGNNSWRTFLSVYNDGRVGIRTDEYPQTELEVNGNALINEALFLGKWDEEKEIGWGKKLYFRGAGSNSWDDIYFARYNVSFDKTDLRLSLADDRSGDDRFVIGNTSGDTPWKNFFTVSNNGCVGINLQSDPQSELEVNGTIKTKEILVTNTGWADFVFHKDYKLPTLQSVKQHIETHSTLPGIPSEKEVQEKGVNLSEMMVKLLQKVEEQTLYIIQLQEEIDKMKKQP